MSLATKDAPTSAFSPDMVIPLGHVGWEGLQAALKLVGDRSRPRLLYRDGALTLVTPSEMHESRAERIDGVIKSICVVLNLALRPTGSTLFRRQDLDQGIMADKTYYLANEEAVRGVKMDIDLNLLPPPDLAIEVVVTNPATHSLGICGALGIPEVWIYQPLRSTLTFLHLDEGGQYIAMPSSRAFPFLMSVEVVPWVESPDEPYNLWEPRVRTWVRDVLGPRRA